MFLAVEPEGLRAVGGQAEWEDIEFIVDSGASETVVGEEMLENIPTRESSASRRGVEYETANGERIMNFGGESIQSGNQGGTQER